MPSTAALFGTFCPGSLCSGTDCCGPGGRPAAASAVPAPTIRQTTPQRNTALVILETKNAERNLRILVCGASPTIQNLAVDNTVISWPTSLFEMIRAYE